MSRINPPASSTICLHSSIAALKSVEHSVKMLHWFISRLHSQFFRRRLTAKFSAALCFFFLSIQFFCGGAWSNGTKSIFTPDGTPPSSSSLTTEMFIMLAGLFFLPPPLPLPANATEALCFNAPKEKCLPGKSLPLILAVVVVLLVSKREREREKGKKSEIGSCAVVG